MWQQQQKQQNIDFPSIPLIKVRAIRTKPLMPSEHGCCGLTVVGGSGGGGKMLPHKSVLTQ